MKKLFLFLSTYAGIFVVFVLSHFIMYALHFKDLDERWLVGTAINAMILALVNLFLSPLRSRKTGHLITKLFCGIVAMFICYYFSWMLFTDELVMDNSLNISVIKLLTQALVCNLVWAWIAVIIIRLDRRQLYKEAGLFV